MNAELEASKASGTSALGQDPRRWKRLVAIIVALLLLIAAFLYGMSTGAVSIPVRTIWAVLVNREPSTEEQIIWNFRLPRTLLAVVVGMALSVSGAFMQGVMRNPLADPGIIGVSAGAGLMAVIIMLILPEMIYLVPAAAFIGAFIAVMVTYSLAWKRGASPLRIILAGVAVNALAGAVTSGVMQLYSDRVQAVLPWLSGGLGGVSWYHLQMILPYFAVAIVLSIFAVRHANILILGDDAAKLLGQKTERSRLFLIFISTLLAGIAVSVSGLIGFVGLVVPHMVRLIVGNNYSYLLPVSALGGAALVVFADTAARSWFDPLELPVGILLAVVGAPFFLYLLRRGGGILGRT
ncbi:iron ABC transporter permease [Paenibacillus sp. ACRRX]|uniref:FecCD family ABC transporter permease n=1 Tax=unclassified Paenibacillus TaxID=185978 RepID=UPI001EF6CCD2|nr:MULTISPECIES: iron ABC transporter permease [unclassified Paenibacillus]MCG7409102.1 iron ABC transporter permease [Paenibacillus sp. ACRRX]MDK8181898.1 iron ABC transporter permease [Paenibacillus sp. UMB4589-SE434]